MKKAGISIERKVLSNGLVLVTEHMPHMRSVAIGIWVRAGSRGEPAGLNGMAHFIEHMVFKGTSRRNAEQIAREMDSVGGLLDAFTSKEMVSFNAKVLDENLPIAFDVLSDLVLGPLFADEDIAKEKQVILEEIRMEDDNPESLAHETLTQNFWRGHPLGPPILGTRATVRQLMRSSVVSCFERWYTPSNTVITAAGNVHMEGLLKLVAKPFGKLKAKPRVASNSKTALHTHARLITRNKPALEQAHITLAVASYPLAHPGRYAASVLNNILGGSMSSRLFQNIRERQGLAYAVFSELNPYSDAGMLSVYAGTSRSTTERVLRSIAGEFAQLKKEPVAAEELRRAKDQLKGSLVLSLESPGARMSNLARQEIYFGRFFSVEELHASIEAVTAGDVQRTALEFFEPQKIAATVVGPLEGFRLKRDLLAC
jgi:predicted Zn-dependent peptidase